MDPAFSAEQVRAGDDVIAADGESVGTVAAVHRSYLLVEKGVLFVTDYRVPLDAIAHYDSREGAVHLKVTRDQALSSGWDQHPEDPETGPFDTLLTGAASVPDTGDVIAVPDEDATREGDAEAD